MNEDPEIDCAPSRLNIFRSLLCLFVSGCCVGFASMLVLLLLREHDWLSVPYFLLMFTLPAAAYCAGRYWYHGATFLAFGGYGSILFLPGYIWQFMQARAWPWEVTWVNFIPFDLIALLIGFACRETGRRAYKSRPKADTTG